MYAMPFQALLVIFVARGFIIVGEDFLEPKAFRGTNASASSEPTIRWRAASMRASTAR